ncbi:hypothetical protein [Gracilibacillus kekensis]|uniref:Flagellar protein FliT n=1 Tax=Gracilibacillus kekensis TaxID=1027249 RepID=A0A1M7MZ21_9BACI|nr:hypothetical protein [Gracilibacillus kekensis]SHM96482.1 flagellar protein FliT [Gracilibacillus kekensis]
MDALKDYIQKTEVMLQILSQPLNNDKRERAISEVTEIIEEREALTKKIKPPFSREDRELGKTAISLDQKLDQELKTVFQHLKKDMRNAKKQSRSNNSYLNPYKSIAHYDGKFLDSKK